jgi:hypothetical protein
LPRRAKAPVIQAAAAPMAPELTELLELADTEVTILSPADVPHAVEIVAPGQEAPPLVEAVSSPLDGPILPAAAIAPEISALASATALADPPPAPSRVAAPTGVRWLMAKLRRWSSSRSH